MKVIYIYYIKQFLRLKLVSFLRLIFCYFYTITIICDLYFQKFYNWIFIFRIMFSIVHFLGDNSVEAVPSSWFNKKNGTCAWPQNGKIALKLIEKKVDPNDEEFNFFKSREMRNDIGT